MENEWKIVLLNNQRTFATTIFGRIFRYSWQIELFFSALTQKLKIKTFVNTSANAVKTQV